MKESVAAPLVRKAAKQAMFIGKAPFFVLESRTDKMNRSPLFLHPTRVIMKKTDGKPEKWKYPHLGVIEKETAI